MSKHSFISRQVTQLINVFNKYKRQKMQYIWPWAVWCSLCLRCGDSDLLAGLSLHLDFLALNLRSPTFYMYTFGKFYFKPSFCNCKIETVVIASSGRAFVKSDKVYQDLKNFMMQSTSVCIASLVLLLFFSCQGAKFLNCESNWGLPDIQRKMQVNKN